MQEMPAPLPGRAGARAAVGRRASRRQPTTSDVRLASIARAFILTPGEIKDDRRRGAGDRPRERGRKVDAPRPARRRRPSPAQRARRARAAASTISAKWDDLGPLAGGPSDRVHEFICARCTSPSVYNDWGYGERIGYGKGLIALFSGPPGTGKTMVAGLIARALDLELYRVDLAQVVSKWVGETEKNLGQGLRRRRGRPRAAPVRRGRLAVRQAHRGQELATIATPTSRSTTCCSASSRSTASRSSRPTWTPRSTRRSSAASRSACTSSSPTPESASGCGGRSCRRRAPRRRDVDFDALAARVRAVGRLHQQRRGARGVPRGVARHADPHGAPAARRRRSSSRTWAASSCTPATPRPPPRRPRRPRAAGAASSPA